MHGNLPSAVERMLTIKHGAFDKESCDYEFDGVSGDYSEICDLIKNKYGLV